MKPPTTTLSFYVAGSLRDRVPAAALIAALTRRGWICLFDWTILEDIAQEQRASIAAAMIEAAQRANVFVLTSDDGRGAHVELGVALSQSSNTVIHVRHTTAQSILFHDHPRITTLLYPDKDEFVEAIEDLTDQIVAHISR